MKRDHDGPVFVRHIVVDGSHFFVAPDGCDKTKGLCVGSRSMEDAYQQVGPVLSFLMKENHGIAVCFQPKLSYAEYERLFRELYT